MADEKPDTEGGLRKRTPPVSPARDRHDPSQEEQPLGAHSPSSPQHSQQYYAAGDGYRSPPDYSSSAACDSATSADEAEAAVKANIEDVTQTPLELAKPPLKPIDVTDAALFKFIVFGGVLLSFNGGFMNSITLQTKNRTVVSHVTGHATKAAIELGTMNMGDFMNEVALLVFFGFGASITGWMIGKEKFTLGQSYGRLMVSIGSLIFLAMYSGMEMDNHGEKIYHSVYMLAIACGMQNAMTTRYSGAVVRTTHLTGMTTDVGLVVGHLMRKDRDFVDLWKLTLFVPMMLGFFFGGVVAIPTYNAWRMQALWPCVLLLFGGGFAYVLFIARHSNISFMRALVRPVLRPQTYIPKNMSLKRRRRRRRQAAGQPPMAQPGFNGMHANNMV